MSALLQTHERMARLRMPDTGHVHTVSLDEELDVELIQRLNDLAFEFGVDVSSTCSGHTSVYEGNRHARVAFSTPLHRTSERCGQRQSEICVERLAHSLKADDTEIIVHADADFDPRGRRRARQKYVHIWLIATHTISTLDDPLRGAAWWGELVRRMASCAPGRLLPSQPESAAGGRAPNSRANTPRMVEVMR